jgi:hypothetical protein
VASGHSSWVTWLLVAVGVYLLYRYYVGSAQAASGGYTLTPGLPEAYPGLGSGVVYVNPGAQQPQAQLPTLQEIADSYVAAGLAQEEQAQQQNAAAVAQAASGSSPPGTQLSSFLNQLAYLKQEYAAAPTVAEKNYYHQQAEALRSAAAAAGLGQLVQNKRLGYSVLSVGGVQF